MLPAVVRPSPVFLSHHNRFQLIVMNRFFHGIVLSIILVILQYLVGFLANFSWSILLERFQSNYIKTDDENLQLPFLVQKSERITPRVKSQARRQNNRLIALKWVIVCLCTSNIMGDMIKNKKMLIFDFRVFCYFH